jgi:CHAT domain-containing protein
MLAMAFRVNQAGAVAQETPPPGRPPGEISANERARLLQEAAQHREQYHRLTKLGDFSGAVREAEALLAIDRKVHGDLSNYVVRSLGLLAIVHESREDWAAARRALQDVLAIRERQPHHREWVIGDARRALADLELRRALTLQQRMQLWRAEELVDAAAEMRERGQYRAAAEAAIQALQTRRDLLGENHFDTACSLNVLGDVYRAIGDYPRAEPLYHRAMETLKKTQSEEHPWYAAVLNNLALLYEEKGDLARAVPLCHRALEISGKALGEDDPRYATSLHNLAQLYRHMGDGARAEPLYVRALQILKNARLDGDELYAASTNGLAMLCLVRGDYIRAELLSRRALEIRKNAVGENHYYYAVSLSALGSVYAAMGDYARAEPHYLRAQQIMRQAGLEDHPEYALNLEELSRLYVSMGDYHRAAPLTLRTLDIRKKAWGESNALYIASLHNLGVLYWLTGNNAQAEPLLRKSIEKEKDALGEDFPEYAGRLRNLAMFYAGMGNYVQAEPLFRRALDIRRKASGEDHPEYAKVLTAAGKTYLNKGEYDRARSMLTRAAEIQTAFFDRTGSALGERARLELLHSLRGNLDAYLSVPQEMGARPEALYHRVLDWKQGPDTGQNHERLSRDRPELKPVLEELASVRAQLAHLAFSAPTAAQRESWRKQLDALRERRDDLEAELGRKNADDQAGKPSARVRPEDVASALPAATALVDLIVYTHYSRPPGGKGEFKGESRLLVFVVQRERPVVCVALGAEKSVNDAVSAWHQALQNHQPEALQQSATALGRLVWEPLRSHLANVQTVLVAPDGPIASIPFAALPGRQPGSYLIEDVAIGYVGSGRSAVEAMAARKGLNGRGLLVAGAIDFQADPGSAAPIPAGHPSCVVAASERAGFAPLPGTKAEGELARELFRRAFPDQKAVLLTGGEPTEGEVKKRLDSGHWRAVHLGTHGFFESPSRIAALRASISREQPFAFEHKPGRAETDDTEFELTPLLKSGVVLAGGGRAPDPARSDPLSGAPLTEDGILTAEEVQSLDLRGTELVVLSACDTGLGQGRYGQGVLGLQRAFHAAGARAVIASLWKVDDAATSVLMEQFYTNLWVKKQQKLEALRQAQIAVLNDPGSVTKRRAELAKGRGIGETAAKLPEGGRVVPPSPRDTRGDPSLWAAFVLSGDQR